jgi:phage gp36-like protein
MSYIDVPSIKAFVKENSWLNEDTPDAGTVELISQIDSIIYNKTKVPVPTDAATTPGILRNHAVALLVYFSSGKAGELTQDERIRRAKLYDDAMLYLNDVEAGKTVIYDDAGDPLSISSKASLSASFTSTQINTAVDRP